MITNGFDDFDEGYNGDFDAYAAEAAEFGQLDDEGDFDNAQDDIPEQQFPTVYEFVDQLILPTYATTKSRLNNTNWAARWWSHPEAVARLDGMWRRYELLRLEEPATYFETFLRLHADYHMRQLMDPEGVFADCRRNDMPSVPLPSDPTHTNH